MRPCQGCRVPDFLLRFRCTCFPVLFVLGYHYRIFLCDVDLGSFVVTDLYFDYVPVVLFFSYVLS